MNFSKLFEGDAEQVRLLVDSHPFALIVSRDGEALQATPVPLLYEEEGANAYLLGHFARANPHVAALTRDGRALAVFLGCHGYISPSWMSDKTQAPTWNYETAHFDVEVAFDHAPEAAREAVDRITEQMERGRVNAWSVDQMGERYHRLVRGVISFRAKILTVRSKFKLGQNERLDVLEEILRGLDANGKAGLSRRMRAANRERLAAH